MIKFHKWLAAFVFDLGTIIGIFVCMAFAFKLPLILSIPIEITLVFLLGTRQHALAVLAHDGAHRLIHPDPHVNDEWAQLCFHILGGHLDPYRQFHAGHHAHVLTFRDPELLHVKDPEFVAIWSMPLTKMQVFKEVFFILFGFEGFRNVAKVVILTRGENTSVPWSNILFFSVLVTACIALGLWWIPLAWMLALGTGFWLCFYLRIWTEHIGAAQQDQKTWNFDAPLWMRLVTHPHGVWMHDVHHRNTKIPFYELKNYRQGTPLSPRDLLDIFTNKD